MKQVLTIAACCCIAITQVLASSQYQLPTQKYISQISHPKTSSLIRTPVLRKRGGVFSKKQKPPEAPEDRIHRLQKMTPTAGTLGNMQASADRGSGSGSAHPSAAKVSAAGKNTYVWSRTHDGRSNKQWSPFASGQQHSIAVDHQHGSAVGGENTSKKGYIKGRVEGRRIEGRVQTGKNSRATMDIDLGGSKIKGTIGPNTKAEVAFRHPSPTKKFQMVSRLHGKGTMVAQGQAHFGESDVTPNDSRRLPASFASDDEDPSVHRDV